MHIIFQRHHIAPDEFISKEKWAQTFMLESMKIQLREERKKADGDSSDGGED